MKALILAMAVLVTSTATGNAGQKRIVMTVTPLQAGAGLLNEARVLTDCLQSELAALPEVTVVRSERAGMRRADVRVTGSVGYLDGSYLVTVNAEHTATGEILFGLRRECRCPANELPREMTAAAGELAAGIMERMHTPEVSRTRKGNGGQFDEFMRVVAIGGTVVFFVALAGLAGAQ